MVVVVGLILEWVTMVDFVGFFFLQWWWLAVASCWVLEVTVEWIFVVVLILWLDWFDFMVGLFSNLNL